MPSSFQSLKAFTLWLLWFRKFSPKTYNLSLIFPNTKGFICKYSIFYPSCTTKGLGKNCGASNGYKIVSSGRWFTKDLPTTTKYLFYSPAWFLRREHDLISTNWGSQFYSIIELTSSINFKVTLRPSIKI